MEFPALLNYYIEVACGRCIECVKRKMYNFRFRLLHEINKYPKSLFITLTFDDANLSKFSNNPNRAIRLFLDRVRKKYGMQVRHFIIAEYGSLNGRLHYHGILFNIRISDDDLAKLWKYGFVFTGYANESTCKYIVKYLTKTDTKGVSAPRVLSSKGIGLSWLDSDDAKLKKKNLDLNFPTYYHNKLFTKEDLEKISYYFHMETPKKFIWKGVELDYNSYVKMRQKAFDNQLDYYNLTYQKTPRLSSLIRFQVSLESFYNFLEKNNYV